MLEKNDASQLENKLYFKTFEENQNGLMAPLLSKPAPAVYYKVLVGDQLWKRHVDQIRILLSDKSHSVIRFANRESTSLKWRVQLWQHKHHYEKGTLFTQISKGWILAGTALPIFCIAKEFYSPRIQLRHKNGFWPGCKSYGGFWSNTFSEDVIFYFLFFFLFV